MYVQQYAFMTITSKCLCGLAEDILAVVFACIVCMYVGLVLSPFPAFFSPSNQFLAKDTLRICRRQWSNACASFTPQTVHSFSWCLKFFFTVHSERLVHVGTLLPPRTSFFWEMERTLLTRRTFIRLERCQLAFCCLSADKLCSSSMLVCITQEYIYSYTHI